MCPLGVGRVSGTERFAAEEGASVTRPLACWPLGTQSSSFLGLADALEVLFGFWQDKSSNETIKTWKASLDLGQNPCPWAYS